MNTPKHLYGGEMNIAELVISRENENAMSDQQLDALVEAIRMLGFNQPILVRRALLDGKYQYRVIDGAHRVLAMGRLGRDSIPAEVIECSDEQEVLLRLGMNKIRGQQDLARVSLSMDALLKLGMDTADLALSGFSKVEIDDLVAAAASSAHDISDDLGQGAGAVEDSEPEAPAAEKPWAFELTFASKKNFQRAKRALKKAAGKGGDLADGLLALLDAE